MKLIMVLLTIGFVQVSAATMAQRVTYVQEGTTLERLIAVIQQQTGCRMLYSPDQLDERRRIDVAYTDAELEAVMEDLADRFGLSYSMDGKDISLRAKPARLAGGESPHLVPAFQEVRGKIIDSLGQPLSGASVRVLNAQGNETTLRTQADRNGEFVLKNVPEDAILEITFVGYVKKTVVARSDIGHVMLNILPSALEEVEVMVNTGYQRLPKERVTGSFTHIDNELFNRSFSTNVLDRLDGVANGLLFDRRFAGSPNLVVRGQSTILSSAAPLIVLDNFPYEGDINNIDPIDIDQITILKDAAAASIWGARAGNGVIVITTKKGQFNQPVKVTLTSNWTIGDKPDIYYDPNYLNSTDFIALEESLFSQGFYNWMENNSTYPVMTPVVETLFKVRQNLLSLNDATDIIEGHKQNDVRNDLAQHVYRRSMTQQYAANLQGGSNRLRYNFSAGFNLDDQNLVLNTGNRFTVNSFADYQINDRLSANIHLNYSTSGQRHGSGGASQITGGSGKGLYPYARLVDGVGTHQPLPREYNSGIDQVVDQRGLLSWQYVPLDDLRERDQNQRRDDVRLNSALRYRLADGLSVELRYQLEKQVGNISDQFSEQSFFARNLINQYAYVDASGQTRFPVPQGGIRDETAETIFSNSGRFQTDYQKRLDSHEIHALAGFEARDVSTNSHSSRVYGYNQAFLTSQPVDYNTNFLLTPLAYGQRIPYSFYFRGLEDRNLSYYANASYTYNDKYTFSASARKDQSNLFGVRTNQKGVPLWSAGVSWLISSDKIYPFKEYLPHLRLRSTYGYSGNVNKTVSAYTTARYTIDRLTGLQQAQIMTPPNPALRWEKTRMLNFGLDFATANGGLSGSFEYYFRNGIDLIGNAPLDPTIGFNIAGRTNFMGNNSSLRGQGMDITLDWKQRFGSLKWVKSFLYSYNVDKVTEYEFESPTASYFLQAPPPALNRARMGVYSYKWAGLDPANGNPRVYLKDAIADNPPLINATSTLADLVYHGPALPLHFGSFRNAISLGEFSAGFNLVFKLGHHFRRTSIGYSGLVNNWIGHKDYEDRWQRSGDEVLTDVPSAPPAGTSSVRDLVYLNSSVLVERGDHVRLQDVNFSYGFALWRPSQSAFNRIVFNLYVNNIGILWGANKRGLDPDFAFHQFPMPTTYTIGITLK